MALINPISVTFDSVALNSAASNKMRVAKPESGDVATFSSNAAKLALAGDTLAGGKATADNALGSKKAEFNFTSGSISVGGATLNLKGFASGTKDDLAIQEDGSGFIVSNLTTGKSIKVDSSGKMAEKAVLDADGVDTGKKTLDITDGASLDNTKAAIVVNNTGGVSSYSNISNTVFSRSATANMTGSDGVDKLFAYGGIAGNVNMGKGDDMVYTSKITGGSINMGEGNSYIKTGTATGGTVTMGDNAGESILDASGTLGAINIKSGANAAAVAISSKGMTGTKVDFSTADNASIDVAGGIGSGTDLKMGTKNSLVANSISGSGITMSTVAAGSMNANILGGIKGLDYTGGSKQDAWSVKSGVADSKMNFGDGQNSFVAGGAITKSSITSTGTATTDSTYLGAASFTGDGTTSAINLGGGGNTINMKGGLSKATVNLGDGNNTVNLGSIQAVTMSAGAAAATGTNTMNVSGAASDFNYTGNAGADTFNIKGGISKSDINAGEGNLTFNASGAMTASSLGASGAASVSNINLVSFAGGTANAITMGNGANTLNISKTLSGGTINTGQGASTVNIGNIAGSKAKAVNITMGGTSATTDQALNVSGAASYLTYTGSGGKDAVKVAGNLTMSNLSLGNGNNSVDLTTKSGKFGNMSGVNITSTGTSSTNISAGSFMAAGTQSAGLSLGGGGNAVNFSGNVGGATMLLGDGANSFNAGRIVGGKKASGAGSAVNLRMGGTGTNAQTVNIGGAANYFNLTTGRGNDMVKLLGNLSNSTVALGEGDNQLSMYGSASNKAGAKDKAYNISNSTISASGANGGSLSVTAGSISGSKTSTSAILATAGDNFINLSGKVGAYTDINLKGDGSNTLNATGIGGVGTRAATITMGGTSASNAAETQTLNISGAVSFANVTLGKGDDNINIGGNVKNSSFDLGAGDNNMNLSTTNNDKKKRFNFTSSSVQVNGTEAGSSLNFTAGAVGGTAKAGSRISMGVTDNQKLDISSMAKTDFSVAGGIDMTLDKLAGVTLNLGSGSSTITVNKSLGGAGAANAVTLNMSNGAAASSNILNVKGNASNLTYNGGAGADSIRVDGNISKSTFSLGAGANSLTTTGAKTFSKGTSGLLLGTSITSSGNTDINVAGSNVSGKVRSSIDLTGGTGTSNLNLGLMRGIDVNIGGTGTTNISAGNAGGAGTSKASITGTGASALNFTAASTNNLSIDTSASSATASITLSGDMRDSKFSLGGGAAQTVNIGGSMIKGTAKSAVNAIEFMNGDGIVNVAKAINNSAISSMEGLQVTAETANKATITGGSGSTTVNVSNSSTNSTFVMKGTTATTDFTISTKLLIGGSAKAEGENLGKFKIKANELNGFKADLANMTGELKVDAYTANSTITMKNKTSIDVGGKATIGSANERVNMEGITIKAEGDSTIFADTIKNNGTTKSSFTFGNGDNTVNAKNITSAEIKAGTGTNIIGNADTVYKNAVINLAGGTTGDSTVQGKQMEGGSVTITGAAGATNTVAMSESMNNVTTNMGAGENSLTTKTLSGGTTTQSGSKNVVSVTDASGKGSLTMTGADNEFTATGTVSEDFTVTQSGGTIKNKATVATLNGDITTKGGAGDVLATNMGAKASVDMQGDAAQKFYSTTVATGATVKLDSGAANSSLVNIATLNGSLTLAGGKTAAAMRDGTKSDGNIINIGGLGASGSITGSSKYDFADIGTISTGANISNVDYVKYKTATLNDGDATWTGTNPLTSAGITANTKTSIAGVSGLNIDQAVAEANAGINGPSWAGITATAGASNPTYGGLKQDAAAGGGATGIR